MGNVRLQAGDYDRAIALYTQALKQCPTFVDAVVALGAA